MSVDLDQTPRSLLVCERSSFCDENNRVSSQVEQLHFNYKVSVLLSDCSSAPSHLESLLTSFSHFYLVRNLPLHELLDKQFLETAVYQGNVYGLSYRTRLDEDNCVALMPNGHLVLSLDKDSFQVLGFEGKTSTFNYKTKNRYVVTVDLTDGSMAPGRQAYLRLLTGLTSRLPLQMDFLLSHHPGGGASLQALLSRYIWSEHKPEVGTCSLTHLPCPDLQSCDPHGLLEWLGAVDANISRDNSSSSFLSSLVCPEPKRTVSRALRISICGLLLPHDVQRLIQELRCYLGQCQPESWVSLTVHGFVDSPVSWGGKEHGVLRGGENFYTLFIFHDHTYHLHLAAGAQDTCPP
ncbi:ribonuclease P protein subunit p40 isoform X2 [Betta splendens]|uniref:Ribonuclease P protein subunit p40 isoform X2 n=1 Tax=Betta splendens TaxID=158456 RepID=A0A6P7KX57_BETSP|nr:ribonuclease P protein subunit p40 isoform X2 [Betta splendens]